MLYLRKPFGRKQLTELLAQPACAVGVWKGRRPAASRAGSVKKTRQAGSLARLRREDRKRRVGGRFR